MSKFIYLFDCHESVLDSNDAITKTYEENLPHSAEIIKYLCESWNDQHDFMLGLLNKECNDIFASCKMRYYRSGDNRTVLAIDLVAKPKKYLRHTITQVACDFLDGQMSDGWGETVFGFSNIMTVRNTKFIIE